MSHALKNSLVSVLLNLAPWKIAVLLGLGILAFYWPVFTAEFGIIDDHEIMAFQAHGRLKFVDIWPTLLSQTEVGEAFSGTRFRPIYYTFRLLETWAWGDKVAFWYMARLVIFTYFILESVFFICRQLGPLPAVFFFPLIAYSRVFVDIIGRLGPSEAYCLLGCALCLTAARKINTAGFSAATTALLATGSLIAVGSKENFIFVTLPLAVAIIHQHKAQRFILGITLAICLLIWSAVLPGTLGAGQNVYATPILQLGFLQTSPIIASLIIVVIAVGGLLISAQVIVTLVKAWGFSKKDKDLLLWCGFFIIALMVQFIVYGELSTSKRYGFPTLPMLLFLVMTAMVIGLRKISSIPWGITYSCIGILVLASVVSAGDAFGRLQKNVTATHIFHTRYLTLLELLEARTGAAVVMIISDEQASAEPVISLQRFLSNEKPRHPVALRFYKSAMVPDLLSQSHFFQHMVRLENKGGEGFTPLGTIEREKCVAVGFGVDNDHLTCPQFVQIWPLR